MCGSFLLRWRFHLLNKSLLESILENKYNKKMSKFCNKFAIGKGACYVKNLEYWR